MSEAEQSIQTIERPEFIDYFLRSRLKRVPVDVLRKFVLDLSTKNEQKKLSKAQQKELIDKIFFYREFRGEKEDFNLKFNQFIRDHFFSANESVYLLQIPNQQAVIDWINAWSKNQYYGQRFQFSKHTHVLLQERFLVVDKNKIPFPSDVILIVASSLKPKIVPNGLGIVEFFPTVEIEMVFRKGSNLMEARGDLGVILDFVNTVISEANSPLAQAKSFFVGEKEQAKSKAITKAKNRTIEIESLRKAINGSYESISSPVKGDKTSRIQASFEGLSKLEDETDPLISPLLQSLIKDQDSSRMSFIYEEAIYSFGVTKSGGLTFRQYAPEEVVTYIVSKINSL